MTEYMRTKQGSKPVSRKIFGILGVVKKESASNTIGVPPAPNPKKMLPRARREDLPPIHNCFPNLCTFYLEVTRQPTFTSIEQRMQVVEYQMLRPVPQIEVYDFLHAELQLDSKGVLLPWGEIPGTNGQFGFHQFRIQHALVYLMKRGLLWILRPGFYCLFETLFW
jgi:hypothetical protein